MQFINTITTFEQRYFDRSTVTVDRAGLNPRDIIGMNLDDSAIAELAGAPTNSNITLLHYPDWPPPHDERVPPGLYFVVECPYVATCNIIGIYALPSQIGAPQRYGIYIKWIDFLRDTPTPKGMAARMLAIVVRRAWQLQSVIELKLWAAGGREWPDKNPGERWGGYYAWPKYGFDAPLQGSDRVIDSYFPYYPCERDNYLNFKNKISNCASVLDVFQLDGGCDYWKVAGSGDYMAFDLLYTSRSIEMLDNVLGKAGK